jgi:hypothetical protein
MTHGRQEQRLGRIRLLGGGAAGAELVGFGARRDLPPGRRVIPGGLLTRGGRRVRHGAH